MWGATAHEAATQLKQLRGAPVEKRRSNISVAGSELFKSFKLGTRSGKSPKCIFGNEPVENVC